MNTQKFLIACMVALGLIATTVTNAQTASTSGTPTTTHTADSLDASQIDFVTIGSIMPYSIESSGSASTQWISAYTSLTGKTATASTTWKINNTDATSVANQNNITIAWSTAGEHSLKVTQSISIPDYPSAVCPGTEVEKTIYVLPLPSAGFSSTDSFAILPCSATTYNVAYTIGGIGERIVKYHIEKTPYGQSVESPEETTSSNGTAVSDASYFTSTTNYASASALYTTGKTAANIALTLEAGYKYKVTLTEISDHVSRKSGVAGEIESGKASFTVLVTPNPTTNSIKHVKNL